MEIDSVISTPHWFLAKVASTSQAAAMEEHMEKLSNMISGFVYVFFIYLTPPC
jgi:hypothetical protein